MAPSPRKLLWLLAAAALFAACNVSPIPVPLPNNQDSGMPMADNGTSLPKDAGVDMPKLPDAFLPGDSGVMKDAPGPVPDFVVFPDSGVGDGAVADGGVVQDGTVGDGGAPVLDGATQDGTAPVLDGGGD